MNKYIKVAHLKTARHGSSKLVAQCVAGFPYALECGIKVHFVPPVLDAPRTAQVTNVSAPTPKGYVVEFSSVSSPEVAEALAGCYCLAKTSDLPRAMLKADTCDICGFEVVDKDAGFVGKVLSIDALPGQFMLEVERKGQSVVQIPYVDEFIKSVNEEEKCIHTTLPAGLLDL